MMRSTIPALVFTSIALAACSSADDPAENLRIGALASDGTFLEGVIDIANPALGSGGNTNYAVVLLDREDRVVLLAASTPPPATGADEDGTTTGGRVSQNGISAIFPPLASGEVSVTVTSPCLRAETSVADISLPLSGFALIEGNYEDAGCQGADMLEVTAVVTRTNQRLRATGTLTVNDPIRAAQLGVGTGPAFTPGVLQIDAPTLSAGGSTGFSATLAGVDGLPLAFGERPPGAAPGQFFGPLSADEISVETSVPGCSDSVTIDVDPIPTSGPAVISGNLTDDGCAGLSSLQMNVTLARDGVTRSAQGSIDIADAGVSGIVSGDLTSDTVRVLGIPSAVTSASTEFTVSAPEGPGTIAGRTVNFALQGSSAIASLSTSTAITDTEGKVRVTLNAGRQPGTVSVIASLQDPATGVLRSTQSPTLRVVNGLPVQGNLSLSASCNNIEAAMIDGDTVDLQVLAQDISGRPVVDGTEIEMLTDGGSVIGECLMAGGVCEVQFRAQAPRPASGIVTVLAHTPGQEGFTDENNNGRRDADELFVDLPEAFIDANDNGIRDPGEAFVDLDGDGLYTDVSGLYEGYTCTSASNCSVTVATVRDSTRIAFSAGQANVALGVIGGASLDGAGQLLISPNTVLNIVFIAKDTTGLPLPNGTTVQLIAEGQAGGAIVINDSLLRADCDASTADVDNEYAYTLQVGEPLVAQTGQLRLTTVSPSGITTVFVLPMVVQ